METTLLYVSETLDRSTGRLVPVDLGNYVTVTELGKSHGVGRQKVRAILHHMGLLGREGTKYRLARFAVRAGLGIRHDTSRSGYAFDVISPEGQRLIASTWEETLADLERELAEDPAQCRARAALALFKEGRKDGMGTQREVWWLRDHYGTLTFRQIASIISVSEQLVGRYGPQPGVRRSYLKRQKEQKLPNLSVSERFERFVGALRANAKERQH